VASILTWQNGWRYGLMGAPLAFVALPLYVMLPNHYAREYGVPLASLGATLLAIRLADTVIDPLLGRWADSVRPHAHVLRWAVVTAMLMCGGFTLLFFPSRLVLQGHIDVQLWLVASLLLTTLAFSALSILHQTWGARLGGDAVFRSRVVAWREGLGLIGVIVASIAPVALGLSATTALLYAASLGGWLAWRSAVFSPQLNMPALPYPPVGLESASRSSLWLPWQRPAFVRLLAVFMLNGIASAVPATLMLFFVQDRLQAPESWQPLFLGSYFVCAALSIGLWLRLVPRWGLAGTWLAGMGLSVLVFAFASVLGAGDTVAFVLVCALSGIALGPDLALPAALLTGVIQRSGDQQHLEGSYFGWWTFAAKLNLALAAGLALPLLGWLGYTPGTTDAKALSTLTLAYCVLPCFLKALAGLLLYTLILRKAP
jgi:GPH family glycoside/pentoside/hexuronide:cation symporter